MIQHRYAIVQDLRVRTEIARIRHFKRLGGQFSRPPHDARVFEELWWQVELMGLTGAGLSCLDAIDDWISAAIAATVLRATDLRPEDPYNGQCPAGAPGHTRHSQAAS